MPHRIAIYQHDHDYRVCPPSFIFDTTAPADIVISNLTKDTVKIDAPFLTSGGKPVKGVSLAAGKTLAANIDPKAGTGAHRYTVGVGPLKARGHSDPEIIILP